MSIGKYEPSGHGNRLEEFFNKKANKTVKYSMICAFVWTFRAFWKPVLVKPQSSYICDKYRNSGFEWQTCKVEKAIQWQKSRTCFVKRACFIICHKCLKWKHERRGIDQITTLENPDSTVTNNSVDFQVIKKLRIWNLFLRCNILLFKSFCHACKWRISNVKALDFLLYSWANNICHISKACPKINWICTS